MKIVWMRETMHGTAMCCVSNRSAKKMDAETIASKIRLYPTECYSAKHDAPISRCQMKAKKRPENILRPE
jgi:hypothetical protein